MCKFRTLYAGSAKCDAGGIYKYIYIYYYYRKIVPVVRLGWLAPARQYIIIHLGVITAPHNARVLPSWQRNRIF